jgi:hypothetical protein
MFALFSFVALAPTRLSNYSHLLSQFTFFYVHFNSVLFEMVLGLGAAYRTNAAKFGRILVQF